MKRKAKILVVDDEVIMRESIADWLRDEGHEVNLAEDASSALAKIEKERPDVAIVDLVLPGIDGLELLRKAKQIYPEIQVIIITAYGSVPTAITAVREGAFDYLEKPFCPEKVESLIDKLMERKTLLEENLSLRQKLEEKYSFENIIGKSSHMQKVIEVIQVVARSNAPVLITGESGTGKELVARAIHSQSYRKGKPFVPVSCASMPENILESELFGHEKGFTGTAQTGRRGKLEAAHKGTLYLSEVVDISPNMQVNLLRAIKERGFRRAGGRELMQVDVRVISSSNKDIRKAVSSGIFREDLYYQLNVVGIELPPLRERREDIVLLAEHFLRKFSKENRRKVLGFSPDGVDYLLKYEWPGNVRELENAVERAVILAQDPYIDVAGLSQQSQYQAQPVPPGKKMEEVEKNHILNILVECSGNCSEAARVLGISRMTLYNKIKVFELDVNKIGKS